MAKQAASRYGVPGDLFAAQMQWESGGFDPDVISGKRSSSAGAQGIAQFMPETARGMGVDPLDPQAALDAAARYMAELKQQYGSWDRALIAYNGGGGAVNAYDSGQPYAETQSYLQHVNALAGQHGEGTPTGPAPAQGSTLGPDLAPAQFGQEGQATGVATAICGPIAAIAFARATGRAPTVAEALDIARQQGLWDEGSGMHGPAAEQALLEHMGVASRLDDAPSPDAVIRDVQNGNPVILSSPGHYHYFVVTGYDPQTGLFDTGNTGEALRGGSRYRTWDDIAPQAALFIDEPTSPAPSVAASPQQPRQYADMQRPAAPTADPTGQMVQQATTGEQAPVQQNVLQQALGTVEGAASNVGNAALGVAGSVGGALLGGAGTALDLLDRPARAVRSAVDVRMQGGDYGQALQAAGQGLTGQRNAHYSEMIERANPGFKARIPDSAIRDALAASPVTQLLGEAIIANGGISYSQLMGAATDLVADPLNALPLLGKAGEAARVLARTHPTEVADGVRALLRGIGPDTLDLGGAMAGVTSDPVRGPLEEAVLGRARQGGPVLAGGAEDANAAARARAVSEVVPTDMVSNPRRWVGGRDRYEAAIDARKQEILAEQAATRQPHQMTRAEFEATGQDLLHGTSRPFETFDPAASPKAGRPRTTPGFYFTDDPSVAGDFAQSKTGRLVSITQHMEENMMDPLDPADQAAAAAELRAGLAHAMETGRSLWVADAEGGELRRLAGAHEVTDAMLWGDEPLTVFPKGREPRTIATRVYGRTLDLTDPKNVPADLRRVLEPTSFHPWEQGAGYYFEHEHTPELVQWAQEHGYGKIKVADNPDSGGQSILAAPDYIGYGRDPHRAFVEQALARGEMVPPEVLADYPDIAAGGGAAPPSPPALPPPPEVPPASGGGPLALRGAADTAPPAGPPTPASGGAGLPPPPPRAGLRAGTPPPPVDPARQAASDARWAAAFSDAGQKPQRVFPRVTRLRELLTDRGAYLETLQRWARINQGVREPLGDAPKTPIGATGGGPALASDEQKVLPGGQLAVSESGLTEARPRNPVDAQAQIGRQTGVVIPMSAKPYDAYRRMAGVPAEVYAATVKFGEDVLRPVAPYYEQYKTALYVQRFGELVRRFDPALAEKVQAFIEGNPAIASGEDITPRLEEALKGFKSEYDLPAGLTPEDLVLQWQKAKASAGDAWESTVLPAVEQTHAFTDSLMRMLVDHGMLSDAEYATMRAQNQAYANLKRVAYIADNMIAQGDAFGRGRAFDVASSGIKALEESGSVLPILEPDLAMDGLISKTYNLVARNDVGAQTHAALETLGDRNLYRDLAVGEAAPPGWGVVHYMVGGKVERYAVPPELSRIMLGLGPGQSGAIANAARWMATPLRAGAVGFNWGFAASNILRDPITATGNYGVGMAAYMGHAAMVAANSRLAYGVRNEALWREFLDYMGSGAGMSGVFETLGARRVGLAQVAGLPLKRGNGAIKVINNLLEAVESPGVVSELTTRIAAYHFGLAQGLPVEEAALLSRNSTFDMAKAGELGRALNVAVPFVNARWQSTLTTLVRLRDDPRAKYRLLAQGIVPAMSIIAWNELGGSKRDDSYWDVPDYERQNANIFVVGSRTDKDGRQQPLYVAVPRDTSQQFIYSAVEAAVRMLKDKDPDSWDSIAQQLVADISPFQGIQPHEDAGTNVLSVGGELLPPPMRAGAQSLANYDFFRRRKIVPDSEADLPPEAQVGEYTTNTARAIGKLPLVGGSPRKVETFIQTTGGSVPMQLMRVVDAAIRVAQGGPVAPDTSPDRLPGISTFVRGQGGQRDENLDREYQRQYQASLADAYAALQQMPEYQQADQTTQRSLVRSLEARLQQDTQARMGENNLPYWRQQKLSEGEPPRIPVQWLPAELRTEYADQPRKLEYDVSRAAAEVQRWRSAPGKFPQPDRKTLLLYAIGRRVSPLYTQYRQQTARPAEQGRAALLDSLVPA